MIRSVLRRALMPLTILLLALVFLLDQAPASLAARLIADATNDRARLGDAVGTVWHGGAQLLALDADQQARSVTRLRWDLDGAALRQGELVWQLRFDGKAGGRLHVARNGISVENFQLELPAIVLEPWLAGPLPIRGLSGVAQFKVPQWGCTWQAGDCSGRADLQWTAARIASISETTLGSFAMTLDREAFDVPWRYQLATLNGVVNLTLGGTSDQRTASLAGSARAASNAPAKLQHWLTALGPRQGDTVQIKLNFMLATKVGGGKTAQASGTMP